MTTPNILGRREFLRGAVALAALGTGARLDIFDIIPAASAQAGADYKALVCVFLFGGNDGNNTVIPFDTAGYAQYAAVRAPTSGIHLAQAELLPIQPASTATAYGLHPGMRELQTLFTQRKLAILANVGTLTQPTTKAQYQARQVPQSLFSHSDQQAQWQSSISNQVAGTGWGGRIADTMSVNGASGFPIVTSLDGSVLFGTGKASAPLSIPVSGSFALAGFSSNPANNARLAAMKQIQAAGSSSALVNAANAIGSQAIALSATMSPILANPNSTVAPIFSTLSNGNNLGKALLQVAKTIEARAATGAKRQIFFVGLGGFDTHSNQMPVHANLLEQLSPALLAFYEATVALGVSSQVTTFTLSDFGRTFQPASGAGTDHAWGSQQFVIGDAVKGGDMYGAYPTLALGGPSDAENRGRWIPTTSVDQYGATLARWFGVQDVDLVSVFPNLSAFATSDVGFMM